MKQILSFSLSFKYFNNAVENVQPLLAGILTIINYVLFPDEAYYPAAIGLVGAMVLDIITKYYALSYQNGGLTNAVRTKKITSRNLWDGTKRKIVETLVIMILAGLSVRVTMLTSVAVFLATIAYSIMFLKECQSIIENMIDAGHDNLSWLLFWLQRKERKVLEDTNESAKASVEASIDNQLDNCQLKETPPGFSDNNYI